MVELPVLNGYCTIQLYEMVGGSKRWSHSIIWEVCGNTLVDEVKFQELNQYRWSKLVSTHACYVYRREYKGGGKSVHVFMAREVLNLPRNAGSGSGVADHRNYDTLENTTGNLRAATSSQSGAHRMQWGSSRRFRRVFENCGKYTSSVFVESEVVYFTSVSIEVEAALMHNYAAYLIQKEFAELNIIPEDEMPTYERQWKLYDMVVAKLRAEGFPCADALIREIYERTAG
jgi:hypothetical protein